MSSYHSSFTYLNKNSSGEGFIIASFEPDSGFVDTYLDMEQVAEKSYDGVKTFLYGNKFNMQPTISITLVKPDGSDFTVAENRMLLRWLTGYRQASWLDFYIDDTFTYSFLGSFTSVKQRKLDARVVGIEAIFTSVNPWAWSILNLNKYYLGEEIIQIDEYGVIYRLEDGKNEIGIDESGVIFNDENDTKRVFYKTSTGVAYNDIGFKFEIQNDTDDLYTYVNLNVDFNNENGTSVIIANETLGENTILSEISPNETIKLTSSQVITSTIPNKIFGDSFNFVWPRLAPGVNNFYVDGSTKCSIKIAYRYPMKVGDCAINVHEFGINPMLEGKISGAIGSMDGIDILGRKNITLTDEVTKSPYEVSVIDGYLAFTETSEPNSNNSFAFVANSDEKIMNKITINNNRFYISSNYKGDIECGRECVVFVDESTSLPYKVIAQDGSLYISEI